jgi:hypothetical protein
MQNAPASALRDVQGFKEYVLAAEGPALEIPTASKAPSLPSPGSQSSVGLSESSPSFLTPSQILNAASANAPSAKVETKSTMDPEVRRKIDEKKRMAKVRERQGERDCLRMCNAPMRMNVAFFSFTHTHT